MSSDMYDSVEESAAPLCSVASASSLDGALTRQERFQIRFKLTYRMRRLKNRGAILILVWNFLITTMFFINGNIGISGDYDLQFNLQMIAGGVTLTIAGWLADVCFGRYKIICCSMWMMWLAYMLNTASTVVKQSMDGYSDVSVYVSDVLMIIAAIGLGSFQANIIQFGIDQLHDASTDEITSFIIWYVWTGYASGFVAEVAYRRFPKEYEILKMLLMCIYLSLALCFLSCFKHLLVKEPVTQNPFKLIYKVVRYAVKTKHPRYRSAFTYCEDELPSRIDFGKSKYGGPFTIEQVEDVKTFFRLVVVVAVASITFSVIFATFSLIVKLLNMMSITESADESWHYKHTSIIVFLYIWAIGFPPYEFIIYPLLHRLLIIINTKIMSVIGVILLLLTVLSLMLIEIAARRISIDNNVNISIQCVGLSTLAASMDYRWLAVPCVLHSLSIATCIVISIRFIAAQSPYSMRGLIMGAAYGLLILSGAMSIAVSVPFKHNLPLWGTGVVSCGFWQAVMLLIVEGTAGTLLVVALNKYKSRMREDVLPNEHIFAERYYDKDS